MMTSKSYFLNLKGSVYNIPTPSSISYFWNFGSLLGVNLMVQLITGIFLSFHYSAFLNEAFFSVIQIMDDLPYGWLVRSIHANGASFFFIFIYFHIGRGLYMSSFKFKLLWFSGVAILMALMATAFVGYVLPWGQMSLWGATVITNLLSALPWVGTILVEWVWGGFSVSGPTLVRFFSAHFVLPMVIVLIVLVHIILLHSTGSSNPLGLGLNSDKIFFHPYFSSKDGIGGVWMCMSLLIMSIIWYDLFMDPDNFTPANPMITPPHIQPEWYFLFAYSILRSVPTKLGGVVLLVMSILCLLLLPFLSLFNFRSGRMVRIHKIFVVNQIFTFGLLTWLGAMPVEGIFPDLGKFLSVVYFMNMMMIGLLG